MSDATNIQTPPREGESYWAIVARQLRANRLALTGLAMVLTVITIAVFAPLLATGLPLYFRGALPENYENAYFIFIDTIAELDQLHAKPTPDADRAREQFTYLASGLERMKQQLTTAQAKKLDALAAKTQAAFPDQAPGGWAAVMDLLAEVEQEYDPQKIALQPVAGYPALRALSMLEIFFMAVWLTFIIAWFLRRRIAPLKLAIYLILLPSLAAAIIWRQANPPYFDVTNYKKIVAKAKPGEVRASFTLCPYGENENITADSRQPPTWLMDAKLRAAQTRNHWLGTDTNGRDVLCRMIYGSRISISIGFVAVGLYIIIGVVLGALAGYYGGWVDIVISRAIELMICFPVFFLILIVLFFFRPSIINIMVVLGLTGWPGVARLQRGEFLRLKNQEFVQAIRALGGSDFRIIFRHILPNGLGPILVSASFGVATAILVESALSFLGFGVPQPAASWGDILNNGRDDIQGAWWLTVFPGIAIFLTVTAYNLFGEGLRDATDPRLKK